MTQQMTQDALLVNLLTAQLLRNNEVRGNERKVLKFEINIVMLVY